MNVDIWEKLQFEAEAAAQKERLLVAYLQETILGQKSFEASTSYMLALKLGDDVLPDITLRDLFLESFEEDSNIRAKIESDLYAVQDRDPAAGGYLTPFLFFKGFHALSGHRFAHYFWNQGRQEIALYLQSLISKVFNVDIHPAAKIGRGILIDHATGVVIGETSVIGNNVSLLHGVTLGGTGKETGDRHPKIGDGVLIAAGSKVLGNITVGTGAKIGAGSVVLEDVAEHCTVVGVPAKAVGTCKEMQPALGMNQQIEPSPFDPAI